MNIQEFKVAFKVIVDTNAINDLIANRELIGKSSFVFVLPVEVIEEYFSGKDAYSFLLPRLAQFCALLSLRNVFISKGRTDIFQHESKEVDKGIENYVLTPFQKTSLVCQMSVPKKLKKILEDYHSEFNGTYNRQLEFQKADQLIREHVKAGKIELEDEQIFKEILEFSGVSNADWAWTEGSRKMFLDDKAVPDPKIYPSLTFIADYFQLLSLGASVKDTSKMPETISMFGKIEKNRWSDGLLLMLAPYAEFVLTNDKTFCRRLKFFQNIREYKFKTVTFDDLVSRL